MPVDLSALGNVTLTAQSLSNLILVNPQKDVGITPQLPGNTTGDEEPEAFLFNFEGENTATLESDITDHYAENNTALQDQIAIKPAMISTSGYIGELNNVVPKALALLKLAADKLTVLSPFVPEVSASALIAYNVAAQSYATAALALNTSVSAWQTISGQGSRVQTKQQVAFAKFFGWVNERRLFTVQTPWAVFKDMAIKTLRVVQDESTNSFSTFEVTFKQMRFANTLTIVSLAGQGRAIDQGSEVVDFGVSVPSPDIGLREALV